MNDHEAQRIAASINRLRPDWPERQLLTLIRDRLIDRPRRDVAVALAWVACESATANPYRVLESGPWWLAAGVDGQTTGRREPFKPAEFCAHCEIPERRHTASDHPFESKHDYNLRLAADRRERTTRARVRAHGGTDQ